MPYLAEDLMLLLLDDESGRSVVERNVQDRVLAGAVLLELANTGRVSEAEPRDDVKTGRLVVRDGSSTGDPLLDAAIDELETKPIKARRAIEILSNGTREMVLDGLVARGLVRRDKSTVLGIFPRTSWPAVDTEHEGSVRERLNLVLIAGGTPDVHIGSLITLLHAADATHKVIPGDKKRLRSRAKEVVENHGEWAGTATRKSIESLRSSVQTVVIAAGATGAGGGGC